MILILAALGTLLTYNRASGCWKNFYRSVLVCKRGWACTNSFQALTIAKKTRKPLFSVGVADVGTTAKHVEANLNKIFNLATTWRAILLM